MIESRAYFEAYKHVLKQLKDMDDWLEDLAFTKLLIHGQPKGYKHYIPFYINEILEERRNEFYDLIKSLKLDESQHNAISKALTYELALIQGPPGTGKTYIGVQLVKILVHFQEYWRSKGPILLVTYTNHALNQFLSQISKFTKSIVRIGGKLLKEGDEYYELEQFNIHSLVRAKPYVKGLWKVKNEVEAIEGDINACQLKLLKYNLKFINTLIEGRECSETSKLIRNIIADFPHHLDYILNQRFKKINEQQLQFIKKEINRLREDTEENILIIFWLGIIDLVNFIKDRLENQGQIQKAYKPIEIQQFFQVKGQNQQQQILEQDDEKFEQEERELDYECQEVQIDERVDALRNLINGIFQSELVSPILLQGIQIESLQELLSLTKPEFIETIQLPQKSKAKYEEQNIFSLPLKNRWQRNNQLISNLISNTTVKLKQLFGIYKEKYKLMKELQDYEKRKVIRKSLIVGMTTTQRSKYNKMLQAFNFPIIIVEEAAEVFEAHIVASLNEQTEHLILIGDHEQLKPNPAVYELQIKFNLSMSMFERLINNDIEHFTLNVQRRMRPEIAEIVKFIYPDLQNHQIVSKYPKVKGIITNIHFFDHEWPENTNELMQSKFNVKEAEICVRFALYLLHQQYKPTQITILTLYSGQLLKIKQIIKEKYQSNENFKEVRVSTVDNYQGEENDIIILSLVRSNPKNNIGFLTTNNRVCVALSRAKHGLYIFGNSQCLLGSKIELWDNVVNHFKEKQFIGNSLKLKCSNHQNVTEIKDLSDFSKVPEGGCTLKCDIEMECGHICEMLCHHHEKIENDRTGHDKEKCMKACIRKHKCGHTCSYKCYECKNQKMDCMTKVQKTFYPCNHVLEMYCFKKANTIECYHQCGKQLICGHMCKLRCSDKCTQRPCKETVERTLKCGHTIEMDCYKDPKTEECYKICNKILECGHLCQTKCKDCQRKGQHDICQNKQCLRQQVCGHQCQFLCTQNCLPCEQNCETSCPHQKCQKQCAEICISCKEPCTNKCQHSECTKLCSQPCNKPLCNEQCNKINKKCYHRCIGLCREKCPEICKKCNPSHQAFQKFWGNESDEDALFIQIDCGHIFEVSGLDKYMVNNPEDRSVGFKTCPHCSKPIKNVNRYMKQIKQTFNDINEIKALILKQEQNSIKQLSTDIKKLKEKLESEDRTYPLFLTYLTLLEYARIKLRACKSERSSIIINDILDAIPFFNSIFQLASINYEYVCNLLEEQEKKEIALSFQDADNFMMGQRLAQKQIQRSAELAQKLSEKFSLNFKQKQIQSKMPGCQIDHWRKCQNWGHIYEKREYQDILEKQPQEEECPFCVRMKDLFMKKGPRN